MTVKDHPDSAASHRNGMEEATDLAMATFSFLTRWNAEILSLYGKRMQEYGLLPFSFTLCTSQDDFADLRDEFYTALQRDYREAAANLSAAVTQVGRNAQNSEGYASVLLKAQEDARAIIDQAKEQARRIVEQAELRTRTTAAAEPRESAAA